MGGDLVSHPDDVLRVLKGMGGSWYTTAEITAALGDYWTQERVYTMNPNQYTNQALQRLKKRGEVECKLLPYCKYAYWKVKEDE